MPRITNPDVLIIGSGAGGGTLAKELCLKGAKVVLLEAGPRLDPRGDFVNDEWTAFRQLSWLDTRVAGGRDLGALPCWIVKAVGGTTVHWAGASIRFQEHEFRVRSEYGPIPGASLTDWPITLEEMLPYYEKAERAMGVAGPGRPNPPLPKNTNFLVMERGAKTLGLHAFTGFMAINPRHYDGRPGCTQCGFCFQGCMNGSKWSTLVEAIPKAEQTGNLDLRPNAQAVKINLDRRERAKSVTYVDELGRFQEQETRVIVIAGNAIETPRLLLNSWTPIFPNGLANSSGQVGKNYLRHTTGSVYALFPKPVHAYKGATMAGAIDAFARHDPQRDFVGGFYLETIILGVPFMAAFVKPGWWGEEFADWMQHYLHLAGMWLVGEDMPQEQNSVTLHPEIKDRYGFPIPVVSFTDHENDQRMREFAYQRGKEVYQAAGAVKVVFTPPYASTHNLGTCRMGSDPKSSVVNPYGQTHDIKNLFIADGSVFTTGAACNPTLTIVALAIRQADAIADQLKKGEI